jgi:hypothetical protein
MGLTFTPRQFQFLQSYVNDMFQDGSLRTGPIGGMITSIRDKFLDFGVVDLTDAEQRFLLYAIQDMYVTSRSPAVQSQLSSSMKFQSPYPADDYNASPTALRNVTSQISTFTQNDTFTSSSLQGSYLTTWEVIQECMTILGLVPPQPSPPPPAFGPTGDPDGISIPQTVDMDDGLTGP